MSNISKVILRECCVSKPLEISAFAPKLELEFVTDWSHQFQQTKCSAYPIAK